MTTVEIDSEQLQQLQKFWDAQHPFQKMSKKDFDALVDMKVQEKVAEIENDVRKEYANTYINMLHQVAEANRIATPVSAKLNLWRYGDKPSDGGKDVQLS